MSKGLTYYRVIFLWFFIILIFFLVGCAKQKILIPDTPESRKLTDRINHNYQKIKNLSGCITLNIKIEDKQIIQRGHFFYKKPNLLKINFMGLLGIPRAIFLINQGIKIYLYSEGKSYNVSNNSNISFFDIDRNFLSRDFKIFKETWKNYIFYGKNKNLWVDKRKLLITKMETFDENKKIVTKTDFKVFKKIDEISVPHKIRVQIFNPAQLQGVFPYFTEIIGSEEFSSLSKKLDILIYLRKIVVNKELKEEMFRLPQNSLQMTPRDPEK